MAGSPFTGHNQHLIFARETSFGTGGGSNWNQAGLLQSVDVADKKDKLRPRAGNSRNIQGTYDLGADYGFTAEYIMQDARILEFALGTFNADVSGPPYNHTITEANDLPSFKAEYALKKSDENYRRTYRGCKINTLKVSGQARGAIMLSTEVIAQSRSDGDQVTTPPGLLSDVPFSYDHLYTVSFNGSNLTDNIPQFDFSVNNNLLRRGQQSSLLTAEMVELNRDYPINLTVEHSDSELHDAFINSTNGNLVFTLRRTASSDEVIVTFTGVELDEDGGDGDTESVSQQEIPLVAATCSIQVNTNTASYPWA